MIEIFFKDGSFSFKSLLIAISVALILTVIIGSIYLLYDKFYKPRRERKLFENDNLSELINYGLKKEEDSYSGYYNKYYLVIRPVSTPDGEWINIATPIQIQNDNFDYIDKMSKKYDFTNNENMFFFHQKVQKFIKIPSAKKIMNKTDIFIQDLITNNIKPLTNKVRTNKVRFCERSQASHNLNRWLDKPPLKRSFHYAPTASLFFV